MALDGDYTEFISGGLSYDGERDGVWIHDEAGNVVVFLGRNTLIKALVLLPPEPPEEEVPF